MLCVPHIHVCCSLHTEVRGQLEEISSLLLPCGSQGSNSGHRLRGSASIEQASSLVWGFFYFFVFSVAKGLEKQLSGVKRLLHTYGDQSSDPQHPHKKPSVRIYTGALAHTAQLSLG